MVTIKDIAKACNVSTATVSKALNGYGDIGADTSERIRKVAKEMHYQPNLAARILKTNISHNIGVIFQDRTESGLAHEYFSKILNSAKDEAESRGYDITFISKAISNNSFVDHCRYRRCDGVLLVTAQDYGDEAVLELIKSNIPTLVIDFSFNDHTSVISDNTEGAYELAKYLLSKGHRRIAFVHGELTSVTKKRIRGFYQAFEEMGLTPDENLLIKADYHDAASCDKATRKLMKLQERPTAIMYPDDFSAVGGLNALDDLGLSVPEDISVVGYDGILLSQVLKPKLTTWHQNTDEIGRTSARKLIESIENPKTWTPEQIFVHGSLWEGASVRAI